MSQQLNTWQEVVLVAGPAIAALAALASWASVWQSRKLARESSAPLLMAQKIVNASDNTIGAVVTNAGGGAARGAGIYISYPPYVVQGALGHGFLYPGEKRQVLTNIPAGDGVETDILLLCRDKNSFGHFWSANEDHRVYKTRFRRRPRYRPDIYNVFREFHPAIDLRTLTEAQMTVIDVPR
jgi:hypothetical protein